MVGSGVRAENGWLRGKSRDWLALNQDNMVFVGIVQTMKLEYIYVVINDY
jgi:hypothetical protein